MLRGMLEMGPVRMEFIHAEFSIRSWVITLNNVQCRFHSCSLLAQDLYKLWNKSKGMKKNNRDAFYFLSLRNYSRLHLKFIIYPDKDQRGQTAWDKPFRENQGCWGTSGGLSNGSVWKTFHPECTHLKIHNKVSLTKPEYKPVICLVVSYYLKKD